MSLRRVQQQEGEDADADEGEEHQRRRVGGDARRDRRQPQPAVRRQVARCGVDEHLRYGIECADHSVREHAEQQAQEGERTHGQAHADVHLACVRHAPLARRAQECHAVDLNEAGCRKRRRQCQHRGGHRDERAQHAAVERRRLQRRLEREPFGDETVERRQARDRETADEEEHGGLRHAVDQPAHVVEVPLVRGVQDRARAEEQQA